MKTIDKLKGIRHEMCQRMTELPLAAGEWAEELDAAIRDLEASAQQESEPEWYTHAKQEIAEEMAKRDKSGVQFWHQEAADGADLYANDYGQDGNPGRQFDEIANVINDAISAAQEDE